MPSFNYVEFKWIKWIPSGRILVTREQIESTEIGNKYGALRYEDA